MSFYKDNDEIYVMYADGSSLTNLTYLLIGPSIGSIGPGFYIRGGHP